MAKAALANGVLPYPVPAGHGIAWLSHRDLAVAVAAASGPKDLVGTSVDVGGRDVVTGPELAAAFSEELNRRVDYVPVPVDDFEKGLANELGAEIAAGVAGLYREAASPDNTDLFAGDPTLTEALLGIRLTPLRTWIHDRAGV